MTVGQSIDFVGAMTKISQFRGSQFGCGTLLLVVAKEAWKEERG